MDDLPEPHADFGMLARALRAVRGHSGSPLDELKAQLLRLQIARELNTAAVPYLFTPWPAVDPSQRQDIVILGPRGTGKTATAVAFAHELGKAQELPVLGVDWPTKAGQQLDVLPVVNYNDARDAVLILDEAELRAPTGRRSTALWNLLSLARHRNLSLVWTSQSGSAINRDILRMEPILCWTGGGDLAAAFDRPELERLNRTAGLIGMQAGWPQRADARVLHFRGAWILTHAPLPPGWDAAVSRLWR